MKKIMTLMLGLSLVLGSTALFGGDDTDTSKKTGKKGKSKKKKDTTKS